VTLAEKLAQAIESAESDPAYWKDIATTDFTNDLHARMQALNISQGDLARRMGTSRPYITKLLSGGNFTLQTMVRLAMALDAVVRVHIQGTEERDAERLAAAAVSDSHGSVLVFRGRSASEDVSTASDASTTTVRAAWGR
jgi:transcriptional regulator with XRE-family HTH domain